MFKFVEILNFTNYAHSVKSDAYFYIHKTCNSKKAG